MRQQHDQEAALSESLLHALPEAMETDSEATPLAALAMSQEEVENRLQQADKAALLWKRRLATHVSLAVGWALLMTFSGVTEKYNYPLLGIYFTVWMIIIGSFVRSTFVHARAAKALTDFDDIRVVGRLLTAYELHNPGVTKQAEVALKRLLPKLRAEDASLLNSKQRSRLYRELATSNDKDIVLAGLQAVEQVGNRESLNFVEKLAQGKGKLTENAVQEAAQACLRGLQARVAEEDMQQQLLRPSAADGSPQTLLRASQNVPEAAPQELLRPGMRDAGD